MEKFVLDTNLFFNMEPGLGLGRKTEEVVVACYSAMESLKKRGAAEFYMPPSIVDEFLGFFEDKEQKFLKDFLSQVAVKSPDVPKVDFNASIFYKMVEDIRGRSYRGLTVAEEELKRASQALMGQTLEKKDFEIKVGEFVKNLRDRYRNATRTGFLDSVADLDLIVLAKEVDGYLVTTDEGVKSWGRIFGVKEMEANVFGRKLSAA